MLNEKGGREGKMLFAVRQRCPVNNRELGTWDFYAYHQNQKIGKIRIRWAQGRRKTREDMRRSMVGQGTRHTYTVPNGRGVGREGTGREM